MPTMRWREALVAIAALFILSRGALVLVALFLENNIPLGYHGPTPGYTQLVRLVGSVARLRVRRAHRSGDDVVLD